MLDPYGARLDARQAHRAGPEGLGLDHPAGDLPVALPDGGFVEPARPSKGRLGVLAQLEDQVARREGSAGGAGGTGHVAAAALGAGVQVQELLPGEVCQGLVALRPRPFGDGRQSFAGALVREEEVGHVHHHVNGLRVGDVGDEAQGEERVNPPAGQVERVGEGRHAGQVEEVRQLPAHHGPPLEGRPVGGNPERFHQEAGHADPEEEPEEEAIVGDVRGAVIALRIAVGAAIVEGRRPDPPAARHHRAEPENERRAQDVQGDRVPEVEGPLPELPPGVHEADHVVVDHDDHGADEESDEPPEDRQVGRAGGDIPLAERRVAPDGRRRTPEAASEVRHPVGRATPPVFADPEPGAVAEDQDREGAQQVEGGDQRHGKVPENLAGRNDRVGHGTRVRRT